MVQEVITALQVRLQGTYIDCTVGEGGHTLAVLSAVSPPPRVLGLDMDAEALERARQRLERHADNAALVHASYADVRSVAQEHGYVPANGVLFDLGISSLQVDTGERGFSFRQEARLDMRFDPEQAVTARQVVNQYSESELADIIFRLGEEPRARRVARAIARSRPIDTTTQLADVVARALGGPSRGRIHPATRTFQAIRMAVNRELDNIQQGLEQAIGVLNTAGRLAVISYHSLEDRLVKNLLRREASNCICPPEAPACVCGHRASIRLVSRKVIKPSPEEVRSNPRSRSARMRVAERINGDWELGTKE